MYKNKIFILINVFIKKEYKKNQTNIYKFKIKK